MVGSNLKIRGALPLSFLGGVPLSRVELGNETIEIIADGWEEMVRLKGLPGSSYFLGKTRGIKALSHAISHESIHQVLFEIEGRETSLALDSISGTAEHI